MKGHRFLISGLVLGTVAALGVPDTASAHLHFLPHYHRVSEVFGSFVEAADPVTVREYCNGSAKSAASFTHTDSFEAENGWGISIGFASHVVSSAVRFDVNHSYTEQAVYQQMIRPGTCIRLSRIEMYEVTLFQGVTGWPWGNEQAIGMAGRFLYPTYATRERSI